MTSAAAVHGLTEYLGVPTDGGPRRGTAALWQEALDSAIGSVQPVARQAPFREFVETVNPSLLRYEHIPRLIDVGQRIVDGDLTRVMVLMPPQYFKTEVFGRLLPAYFLQQHGRQRAALISYGADLAWSISEEARDYFQQAGGTLRIDTKAKRRWRTQDYGQLWAAGVGGAMLGFGYELGVVDDPVDPEKAHSPKYQRRFGQWWPAKFLSRQGPHARVVLVMQRLGIEDPVDWLFRREVGEDMDAAPEHWHVVMCDEIKSDEPLGRWSGPRGLPPTCTLEPDLRQTGEVLAPSYRDRAEVEKMHRTSSSYVVQAQRQQRPSQPKGDFWSAEWFINTYEELPADAYNGGKDWDTAYTKNDENSATAYAETYRGSGKQDEFPIYLHNVDWDWLEFPELIYWMGGAAPVTGTGGRAQVKGPHYVEAKASGKSAAQMLRKHGIPAKEVTIPGGADKFARAASVQPVVSAGRLWVRKPILRKLLSSERMGLLRVTAEALMAGGPDLDLNDAVVQAIHRHIAGRRMRVFHTGMDKNGNGAGTNGNGHGAPLERPTRLTTVNGHTVTSLRMQRP